MIFRGDENFKKNLDCKCKCLYGNLIEADKCFRTNCCLVINLKQNRFELEVFFSSDYL